MSDGGKGSRPRPFSVSQQEFDNRWDTIFGKKKKTNSEKNKENNMQVKAVTESEIGSCGCGRSPTGKCIGWHGLSEEEYREKLALFEDELNKKNKEAE